MIEPHLNKPCVIVLDEIDYAIREASSPNDTERKVPQQFWSMFDELAENPNVVLIGTTNNISNLPPQIKTRFADSLIEIPDAKPEIKKEILTYYIRQYSHNCDDSFLAKLTTNCKELSIRELEKVVNLAWGKAFSRNSASICILKKDVEDSANELKKKVLAMKKADQEAKSKNESGASMKTSALSGFASMAGATAFCIGLELFTNQKCPGR